VNVNENNLSTVSIDNNSEKPALWASHLQLLQDRAISKEAAEEAGLYSFEMAEPDRNERMLKKAGLNQYKNIPNYPGATGIAIPHKHRALDKVERIRFRFDQTEITIPGPTEGSHHGETTKPLPRYAAQADTKVAPYFTTKALASAADTTVDLFIAEAALKAISLTSNGFAAIGLGGVLAGLHDPVATREAGEVVASPEMQRINWRGRRAFIVFDAGICDNPSVAKGAAYAWRALRDLGADVYIVQIPMYHTSANDLENGVLWSAKDQGPDDFLARNGVEAFQALVNQAVPADPVKMVQHVSRGLVGAARTTAVSELLTSNLFKVLLHIGGSLCQDLVAAAAKLAGISKRTVTGAADEAAERLQRREKEVVEGSLERGDQAEVADMVLKEFGGIDNCAFDESDLWVYEDNVYVRKDLDSLVGRVSLKKGLPIGDKGKVLLMSDGFATGAVALLWKSVKNSLGEQPELGFFGSGPKALGFSNGVLAIDPKTGKIIMGEDGTPKLHPHGKEWRLRSQWKFDYVPGLVPSKKISFLQNCFKNDSEASEKIEVIREFLGTCIFGDAPRWQKSFIFQGAGRDGKSEFAKAVKRMMPPGSCSHVDLNDLDNEYNRAKLSGKLLNIVFDLQERTLLGSGSIKAAITGDTLQARNPYGRPFDIAPLAGHMILANKLPPINDTTLGFKRRWIIIGFGNSLSEGEMDVFFAESLRGDLEDQAFISWMVDGLVNLIERKNFKVPASSEERVNQWISTADHVGQFISERLVILSGAEKSSKKNWTASGAIYSLYQAWCTANGHTYKKNSKNFSTDLEEVVKEKSRTASGVVFPVAIKDLEGDAITAEDLTPRPENVMELPCLPRDENSVHILYPSGQSRPQDIEGLGAAYKGKSVLMVRDGEGYKPWALSS
jgi:P4 family phage/plasmid primase-like protien